MTLEVAASYILPNEPCLELAELNLVGLKPGAGVRRVQIIKVIRDDRVATFRRDMGPARNFTAEEFIFPGAVPLGDGRYDVLETVGRLQGAAEEQRAYYGKPTERRQPPTDMVNGFEEYATRRRRILRGGRR